MAKYYPAPKMPLLTRRSGPPFSTWFLRRPRVHTPPNSISIGSSVYAWLTVVTNRNTQTDHATCGCILCYALRWHLRTIITSCCCNDSDIPHRHRFIDHSIVFARWRQCTVPSTWSLGPLHAMPACDGR